MLALGIGANSAVFSLVQTLLFQPPAYAQPHEIVQLFSQDRKNPKSFRSFSYPTFQDIRQHNTVFSDVMAYNLAMVGLGEKSEARRVFASVVSSNYFSVMGVAPARGRAFLPEEETPGRNAPVAIVSHNYWKRSGGQASLLGADIIVNGRRFSIVGIMPEGFTGTMHIFGSEVWLPLSAYDSVANQFYAYGDNSLGDRAGRHLNLVGRLKPGITAESAAPALTQLGGESGTGIPGRAERPDFHRWSAATFRYERGSIGRRRGPRRVRRAHHRDGRSRAGRRLSESRRDAARAWRGAAEGNGDPAGGRSEPRTDHPSTSHRRSGAGITWRSGWTWSSASGRLTY